MEAARAAGAAAASTVDATDNSSSKMNLTEKEHQRIQFDLVDNFGRCEGEF